MLRPSLFSSWGLRRIATGMNRMLPFCPSGRSVISGSTGEPVSRNAVTVSAKPTQRIFGVTRTFGMAMEWVAQVFRGGGRGVMLCKDPKAEAHNNPVENGDAKCYPFWRSQVRFSCFAR